MNLANIIQDRTNDGISIVDFLFAVMRAELDGFKPCHRLEAAKLLVKYELDEGNAFILNNPPEPSRRRSDSGSSSETEFDNALAKSSASPPTTDAQSAASSSTSWTAT